MKRLFLLLAICTLLFTPAIRAAYVQNQPYQVTSPDGTLINCFVSGDEYFNWLHDAEGFTIIQADDGYYYYGVRDKDVVVPSQYKVNTVDPETVGLSKWAKISKTEYLKRKAVFSEANNRSTMAPHSGTMNNIVVYIKFSDDTEFTTTRQTYDNLFNLPTGNSLKSYYNEVSYTQFTISSSHYPACAMTTNYSYTDTHPRNYFEPYNAGSNPGGYNGESERTIREHALLRDAVNWINANSPVPTSLDIDGDDDNQVDNVCFIVRGGNGAWASLLWAHRWALYTYNVYINGKQVWDYTFQPESQVDVTTLCHEMFHALGSPDLYHYDDGGLNIAPVSEWDLMESGGGHMTAYMKWKYTNNTWIASIPEITTSGTYTLQPLTSSTNNCYKIASPNSSTEFFVVEYRKATGTFESTLPGSGLIVSRIDPALNGNASGPPDEVYIFRPNGTTTNNGSPTTAFYSLGSGRTTINDGTNPPSFLQDGRPGGLNIYNVTAAGNTISFTVGMSTIANPVSLSATGISGSRIDLTWQKNSSNNNVVLAWNTSPTFGIPQTGTTYTAGSAISGGGNVIYAGNGAAFSHLALSPATTYYYKLWSVDGTITYSNGINASANTACGLANLPFSESFQGTGFPPCWTQQVEGTNVAPNWSLSSTTNAGGNAGEMMSSWQQKNPATNRLIMPPFNTTGITQLNLTFRHMLDNYAVGATLRIQSSTNGTSWTNEAWSLQTSAGGNIGPEIINTTISSSLNSATTYLAFTVEGNLYQYDYWYVDDVSVTVSGAQSYTISTVSGPVGGGTTTGSGSYNAGSQATVTALSSTGYYFVNWTEGGNIVSPDASYTFTVNGDRMLVANFVLQQFTVSASSNPSAGGSATGGGSYNYGDQAMLNAIANTGYSFTNWTENGNVVSASAGYSFTVDGDRSLIANYEILQYTVSASAGPPSGGITSGSGTYAYGSQAAVTATAGNGWNFINWTEGGNVVSVNTTFSFIVEGDRILIANFTQQVIQYTISTLPFPLPGGATSGGGVYDAGDQVTVNATPDNGWVFINWTENGSLVSANQSYSFAAASNRDLVANFAQQFNILASGDPGVGGYTSGSGVYTEGETANLGAYANSDYVFLNWMENGNIVSLNQSYSFAVAGNRELIANFQTTVGTKTTNSNGILISPNPSDGLVIVESAIPVETISVISITGKEIWNNTGVAPDVKVRVDLRQFPEGLYFFRVRTVNQKESLIKVIIRNPN